MWVSPHLGGHGCLHLGKWMSILRGTWASPQLGGCGCPHTWDVGIPTLRGFLVDVLMTSQTGGCPSGRFLQIHETEGELDAPPLLRSSPLSSL
jgi:hypothetical protein